MRGPAEPTPSPRTGALPISIPPWEEGSPGQHAFLRLAGPKDPLLEPGSLWDGGKG